MAIIEFLYNGEANIFQESLDSFLALAEELQLKGLSGATEDHPKGARNKTSTEEKCFFTKRNIQTTRVIFVKSEV